MTRWLTANRMVALPLYVTPTLGPPGCRHQEDISFLLTLQVGRIFWAR